MATIDNGMLRFALQDAGSETHFQVSREAIEDFSEADSLSEAGLLDAFKANRLVFERAARAATVHGLRTTYATPVGLAVGQLNAAKGGWVDVGN